MLKYDQGKNPLQAMIDGYEERGKSKANDQPASDSFEALQKRFDENPSSLSPMELLTLGSYQRNAKNNADSKQRQQAAEDQQKKHDEEMISTDSEEFQTLADNMAQLRKAFEELNGGGDE